jgi:hypothetical protein
MDEDIDREKGPTKEVVSECDDRELGPKKRRTSLDARMAVDTVLLLGIAATFLTARRRSRRRRFRGIHAMFAYATLGVAALHVSQHMDIITRYCKKKYEAFDGRSSSLRSEQDPEGSSSTPPEID